MYLICPKWRSYILKCSRTNRKHVLLARITVITEGLSLPNRTTSTMKRWKCLEKLTRGDGCLTRDVYRGGSPVTAQRITCPSAVFLLGPVGTLVTAGSCQVRESVTREKIVCSPRLEVKEEMEGTRTSTSNQFRLPRFLALPRAFQAAAPLVLSPLPSLPLLSLPSPPVFIFPSPSSLLLFSSSLSFNIKHNHRCSPPLPHHSSSLLAFKNINSTTKNHPLLQPPVTRPTARVPSSPCSLLEPSSVRSSLALSLGKLCCLLPPWRP